MQLELQTSTQSKKVPGPPVLPIVGSLPFLGKQQYLTFNELAKNTVMSFKYVFFK